MAIGAVSPDLESAVISGTSEVRQSEARQSEVHQSVAGTETQFSETLRATLSSGSTDLDAIFDAAALRYNVPANLLKAVARAESNFRPDATSRCGAMGIMQLMPGTARALGVTDAYDPEQNIMGGARYLRQMLDRFDGDVSLALAAYNAGSNNVEKYGGIPPFTETQNYVRTVLGYLGAGDITAGTVSLSGLGLGLGLGASPNVKVAEKSGFDDLKASLSQMLLIKILEMQMRSSDDDKDKRVF